MLKGMVCVVCDTGIFSKLETKVMRASPLAMARLFLQPTTRLRGSQTAKPTIEAAVSYFDDPELHIPLEQEFSGGQPAVLPQVVAQPPNMLSVTATDVATANALVEELGALGDTISVVEKIRDGIEVRFTETVLQWNDDHYQAREPVGHTKAPKNAIWLEPLTRPANLTTSILPPRVFRRSKGGLVCRAHSVEQAAGFTCVRANHATIVVPDGTLARRFESPDIHLNQVFNVSAHDRVLTKIGFNVCVRLSVRSGRGSERRFRSCARLCAFRHRRRPEVAG
jgi:hypothetical protein